jgi:hypothetical protein
MEPPQIQFKEAAQSNAAWQPPRHPRPCAGFPRRLARPSPTLHWRGEPSRAAQRSQVSAAFQWASSLDRSPYAPARLRGAQKTPDEGQPIAADADEPQIRRGTSADLRCDKSKTKDR